MFKLKTSVNGHWLLSEFANLPLASIWECSAGTAWGNVDIW